MRCATVTFQNVVRGSRVSVFSRWTPAGNRTEWGALPPLQLTPAGVGRAAPASPNNILPELWPCFQVRSRELPLSSLFAVSINSRLALPQRPEIPCHQNKRFFIVLKKRGLIDRKNDGVGRGRGAFAPPDRGPITITHRPPLPQPSPRQIFISSLTGLPRCARRLSASS
jgi:hypothetical protein